jgi:hypothetical protein
MNFFTDPDPRIRIRVHVTPNSFRKILNMIFFERKLGSAPTFKWIRSCFYNLAFKKDAVPGLRTETRIQTEIRIRASVLAPLS